MTDDELLQRFAAATLTPEEFGHAEHVRLAWLQVTRLPLLEAIRQQTTGLRRLTEVLGVPGRYHATITLAYLLLVHERATACVADDWEAFAAANPDLLARGMEMLAQHWAPESLQAPEARAGFVPPDRAAT